jgi:hypothetical protein
MDLVPEYWQGVFEPFLEGLAVWRGAAGSGGDIKYAVFPMWVGGRGASA